MMFWDTLLEASQQRSGHEALVVNGRSLTYGELAARALLWAAVMLPASDGVHEAGETPRRVGIFGGRTVDSYVAVLAALYAGATFVPLNPSYPDKRCVQMMDDADLDLVVVDAPSYKSLARIHLQLKNKPLIFAPSVTLEELDDEVLPCLQHLGKLQPLQSAQSRNFEATAYMLYTSGSTGTPKGVPISYRNLQHYFDATVQSNDFSAFDRFAQTFDLSFDLSLFSILMAWTTGAALVVADPADMLSPPNFVEHNKISVWLSVPSAICLADRVDNLKPASMPSLRRSLFCGEALRFRDARLWKIAAPNSSIDNQYGPTEVTVVCTSYRLPDETAQHCDSEIVPIGSLNSGLTAIVVDENLNEVGVGNIGEFCVGGPQTFAGYWRGAKDAASTFIEKADEFGEIVSFYRTGDRVLRLNRSQFAFVGRIDSQVKLRGYRIELGEIEVALLAIEQIRSAAAVVRKHASDSTIDGDIIAFFVGDNVDKSAVVAQLRCQLPAYMIPQEVHCLDALPLNSNGKVDRGALLKYMSLLPFESAPALAEQDAPLPCLPVSGGLVSVV